MHKGDIRGHELDGPDVDEESFFRRSGDMGLFIVNSDFRVINKIICEIVVILDLEVSS